MWDWLTDTPAANFGQFLSGVAGVATAAIAGVALFYAYRQLVATPKSQREANAREVWKDYIRICIEYPQFAGGGITRANAKGDVEFEQYEWFAAFMLDACESILLFVADEDEWLLSVDGQLGFHREYLCSSDFTYLSNYSVPLQDRIKKLCPKVEV